jgi:hypothetical protein
MSPARAKQSGSSIFAELKELLGSSVAGSFETFAEGVDRARSDVAEHNAERADNRRAAAAG